MNKLSPIKIGFFGTPDFSLQFLKYLFKENLLIKFVVSQPASKSGILFDGTIDEIPIAIQIDADDHFFTLHAGAHSLSLRLYPAHAAAYIEHMPEPQTGLSDNVVAAPMPGLLTAVMVAAGDRVEQGQDVAIIEAMKMENVLHAGMSGIVEAIEAATGANLNVDEVILTIISDD